MYSSCLIVSEWILSCKHESSPSGPFATISRSQDRPTSVIFSCYHRRPWFTTAIPEQVFGAGQRPHSCTSPLRPASYNQALACGITGFAGIRQSFPRRGTFALGGSYLRTCPCGPSGLVVSRAGLVREM